eukprot:CAMPEP_0174377350 /NCGR_PEP_ID=MMETSP0811_2-20130205/121411_1 /TAXON_ID=73025 ORGANISM="Eutreptiella gymnastica-like, Strain CCMP1594" /NCGR_SAMPLE_ID=MMETSP0811_2 /ASSEMBLY_ACC=CAM_ASM_000667 /LENGTH=557 /DNA_ID=CAMNT_0015529379 /DNA_START=38 /DNA_END=1711 /DNA_ORIENTATION=-
MGLMKHGMVGAILVAVFAISFNTIIQRLIRNMTLPDVPEMVPPAYPPCTDEELVDKVTLVVTVKDTCGQSKDIIERLADLYPADMRFIYAYPDIRGCRDIAVEEFSTKLFNNVTIVKIGRGDAPIVGFLKAQPHIRTEYAVLMHNDAYPMDHQFVCELYRALEAHPRYPIAAPQIYEVGDSGIYVPHGHHENLHVRPTSSGTGHRIDYDLSLDLLTMRTPSDFRSAEGPQVDFLEDHAFFARTAGFEKLLDSGGSFTMEYMDMILNMRARNTSAWYVPTARCAFDVQIDKIVWQDLPYFSYKRSEQIGDQVRRYLTNKWSIEFPNTGIWNYVRYVYLSNIILSAEMLPATWEDQAALFYTWFESLGFNRYNGELLPDFIEAPRPGVVNVSRLVGGGLPADVPRDRVPPSAATDFLPFQSKKSMFVPEIAFKDPHSALGVRTQSCDAADPSSWESCGLVVEDEGECRCWNYVVPYNLEWAQVVLGILWARGRGRGRVPVLELRRPVQLGVGAGHHAVLGRPQDSLAGVHVRADALLPPEDRQEKRGRHVRRPPEGLQP